MIDHIGIVVSDFEKSKAFYRNALLPLGYELLMEFPAVVTGHTDVAGFGEASKPDFWISRATLERAAHRPDIHVAFRAANRAMVDAFHQAAFSCGGEDNGTPGLRPHYHPNYYSAFVRDPDGHNIEVVCHTPE